MRQQKTERNRPGIAGPRRFEQFYTGTDGTGQMGLRLMTFTSRIVHSAQKDSLNVKTGLTSTRIDGAATVAGK
jgi:hypothetical protein